MPNGSNQTGAVSDHLAARILPAGKLFAFWQLHDAKVHFICSYFNIAEEQIVRVLRLYDLTAFRSKGRMKSSIHEVILRPNISSWMFKGVSQNREYVIELGIRQNENHFFPLLRSNEIIPITKLVDNKPAAIHHHSPWAGQVSTYTYYEDLEGSSQK